MRLMVKRTWPHFLSTLVLVLLLSLAGGLAAQTEEEVDAEGAEPAADEATEDWGADEKVRNMMDDWKANDPIAQHLRARDDVSVVGSVAWAQFANPGEALGQVSFPRLHQDLRRGHE